MGTTTSRRGATTATLRNRAVALVVAIGIGITGTTLAAPAYAIDYPSWDDVAAARNNEAATAAAVDQINSLIAGLTAEAERTQKDAEAKATVWQEMDNKYQAANAKANTLQEQADAASAKAAASEQRAGQMAAQLMRAGGGDITTNLLMNSGDADNLLYGLGMSTKISEQANAIYERAIVDKNTAQALTDQAKVARDELETLKKVAEAAFQEAQAASIAAAAALKEQEDNAARLQQQLIVLKEKRAATEADYLAGVKERIGVDVGLDSGEISLSGWAKPVNGPITDGFGWRVSPTAGASSFHQGTDIGAGCGATIRAAATGDVIYAGWNGSYGNFVLINHGGVQTAYGHIVNGGILVSHGQHVLPGQPIAYVGTTGTSTGCHLHLEVRNASGQAFDAVPFFAAQGIRLG